MSYHKDWEGGKLQQTPLPSSKKKGHPNTKTIKKRPTTPVDDGPYTYDPGADDLAKKGAKAAYLMARKNAEDEKKMRVKEAQRKKEDGEEAECAGYSDPHDLDRATEDDVGPQNPNEQQFDAAGPSSSSLEDSVATLSLGNENDTTLELDDSVLFWEVVPAGAPNSVVLSKGRTNKKTTK